MFYFLKPLGNLTFPFRILTTVHLMEHLTNPSLLGIYNIAYTFPIHKHFLRVAALFKTENSTYDLVKL